ncbi:hypothetical protein [Desulfovibrio sp. Huiquan2017]|uniref:hypothetical protein n=1 Tax=Desulfovibrio sp. Huiquan2017 TaxID=2816861 RepID=UPI001A921A67|nr:hypothetical protein [Desulfovibrio sp. Huiquan2017]
MGLLGKGITALAAAGTMYFLPFHPTYGNHANFVLTTSDYLGIVPINNTNQVEYFDER